MAVCSLYIAHDSDLLNGMPHWEVALAKAVLHRTKSRFTDDRSSAILSQIIHKQVLCSNQTHYLCILCHTFSRQMSPYGSLGICWPLTYSMPMGSTPSTDRHPWKFKKPRYQCHQALTTWSPVPGSGQLMGEGPDAYRERYFIHCQKCMEKETLTEKLAHQQQQEQHSTPSQPGRNGPTCWLWEMQECGWWLKNAVSRDMIEVEWQT